jgi:hypothetical protein
MTEICKVVGSLLARYDFEYLPQGQAEKIRCRIQPALELQT